MHKTSVRVRGERFGRPGARARRSRRRTRWGRWGHLRPCSTRGTGLIAQPQPLALPPRPRRAPPLEELRLAPWTGCDCGLDWAGPSSCSLPWPWLWVLPCSWPWPWTWLAAEEWGEKMASQGTLTTHGTKTHPVLPLRRQRRRLRQSQRRRSPLRKQRLGQQASRQYPLPRLLLAEPWPLPLLSALLVRLARLLLLLLLLLLLQRWR